jgi:tRNA (cmo5U34)-methyltransferase
MSDQTTTQTEDQGTGRGWHTHDWHSKDYVDNWLERDEAVELERRPLLRRTADLLPFPEEAHIRVLDVGAGYGALSQEILRRPHAQVVCQDYSEPMTALARERLAWAGDRVSFVFGDLQTPAWTDGVGGPFDAVVSSIAIHNVGYASRIRAIYAEIYSLLGPGGVFFNLELLFPASAMLRRIYYEHGVVAGYRRRLAAERGREVSADEAREEVGRFFRGHGAPGAPPEEQWATHSEPADFTDHLRWLQEAGFEQVDGLWKDMNQVLMAGFRGGGQP